MNMSNVSLKRKFILKIHSKVNQLLELVKFSIVGVINTTIDFAWAKKAERGEFFCKIPVF